MRDRYDEFQAAGIAVVTVSTEPMVESAVAAMEKHYPFPLLSDPDRVVIEQYGLAHDDPDADHPVARPATFILDKTGVVRFGYVGEHPRDRPTIDAILLALRTIMATP